MTTAVSAIESAAGGYRWRICALLFAAISINYVDRAVLGVLAPDLQRIIGWNEIQYSNIVNAFQAAYAIGLLLAGGFMDRIGTRLGYSLSIGVWSAATIATALVRTVLGFGIARSVLGLGESGGFPAAIKTVAEWFPKKERALATGLFNSGTNIGAIVAPLAVPWLSIHYGWQSAFVVLGGLSALWIIPWLAIYRHPAEHPQVSREELAYIQADPPDPETKVPWADLLKYRQTWAFIIGKFMTDPIWWFIMFWLPKFLNSRYHLNTANLGWPIVLVYTMATFGSIVGGWLPAQFFKLGWSANRSRKAAMLIAAIAITPVMFAATVDGMWTATILIGIGTMCHQAWSANIFTLPSDMFPRQAVGSVTGIGGFGGAVGGILMSTYAGAVLQYTGSYLPLFIVSGSVYLIALAIIQILTPRLEPANLEIA